MPQVPYSPVPQVAPADIAIRPSAPPEAFGTGVAQAVGDLGAHVSATGNELWSRAVALQELHNETDAKNANVDFISKAGDLYTQYDSLQGQERVKAYPEYKKNLNDLYQKTRGALTNPSAQRMFDGAAISTLNRSVFSAGRSAAAAQRDAALGAANAEYDIMTKNVYNDPNDEAGFRDAVAKSDAAAVSKAALSAGGASPERVAFIKQQGRSELAYNRIIGMARNQPNTAYKLLDQYEKEGLIFGKEDVAARGKVESLIQSVGMNTVAQQVLGKYLQADGTYSKSSQEMQQEAVKTASDMYPDMPAIATAAQGAFDRNFNQHAWGLMQDERQRKQEISDSIIKGVRSTDMLDSNLLKRMTPAEIKAYPGQANTYQHSIDTQTNDQDYRKYLGLYNNDNGAFMDTNFMSVPGLSKGNRDYFIGLQRKASANGDPRVWKAMKQLQGSHAQVLDDLGVTGPAKDRETANQFVGALHDAIQSYQETNGKAPDEKIISEQIFPAVTRQIATPGWLFGANQTPFFQAAVPNEYAQKFKGIKPDATDAEIQRAYHQQMFDQFFKGQKASKDQSRVK